MSKSIIPQKEQYKHLAIQERECILIYRSEGANCSEIAEKIARHKSTVYRELKRNISFKNKYHYSPSEAQRDYKERISKAHKRIRLKNRTIQQYVFEHLKDGWTPDIIAGRLPLDYPGFFTNYESIYQFIYDQRYSWKKYLPRSHRQRYKRGNRRSRGSRIPDRVCISQRPKAAENRSEIGHWEADTVVSSQSRVALQVLYERKTRLVKISILPRKTARNMANHINYKFSRFPQELKKTITYDNGSENTEHQRVNEVSGTSSYFCNPYHSWEKGGVEQVIGLIRRYFPKRTDFSKVSRYEIKKVQRLLNTRPRKCLGYRTPIEVLQNVALTS